LHGYLKYENCITRFRLPKVELPKVAEKIFKRDLRDVVRPIVREKPPKRTARPAGKEQQEALSFDTTTM